MNSKHIWKTMRAEGREKEYNGDSKGTMNCYKNYMSYFDASERYQVLREDKYRQIYNQTLRSKMQEHIPYSLTLRHMNKARIDDLLLWADGMQKNFVMSRTGN